jgi:hypothetical protein
MTLLSTIAGCTVGANILPLRAHLVNAGGSDTERPVCRDSFEPRKKVVVPYTFTA